MSFFIPDEKLKTILCNFVEGKDILSYFNLQKYIGPNFIKIEDENEK